MLLLLVLMLGQHPDVLELGHLVEVDWRFESRHVFLAGFELVMNQGLEVSRWR